MTRFEYAVDRLGLRTQATETLSGTVRTIDYTYDGLLRLTGATEPPGTSYSYSYDRVGNRTDGGRQYNAANEVVGFTYDDVGNLLNDGSTSYTYDALGRLTQQGGTSYTYNGDGVLVGRGSTSYTQDLVAPLEQVLNDGTTNLVYGHTRIKNGTGTWYQHDGVGSVRAVLDGTGVVQSTTSYDPWGVPTVGSTAPFGFTGELHDGDLVHLRARWYHPSTGTFTARDPFEGFDNLPYSLHPYQYAYSNPVLLTDPSGELPWLVLIGIMLALGASAAAPAVAYAPSQDVDVDALPPSDTFEDGKAFIITAPGTGDINDPYVLLTGRDVFGRPQSRLSALVATCLPVVTVGMLRLPRLRGSSLSSAFSESFWTSVGGRILDPAEYPPSSFPVYQQINEHTCFPTCADMAGVPRTIVTDLETTATMKQGLSMQEFQNTLAQHGLRVTLSDEVWPRKALPMIEQEMQAGRTVIAQVRGMNKRTGNEELHAVLVRSITRTDDGWKMTVHDPSTGKVILLDQGAWSAVNMGAPTRFVVIH